MIALFQPTFKKCAKFLMTTKIYIKTKQCAVSLTSLETMLPSSSPSSNVNCNAVVLYGHFTLAFLLPTILHIYLSPPVLIVSAHTSEIDRAFIRLFSFLVEPNKQLIQLRDMEYPVEVIDQLLRDLDVDTEQQRRAVLRQTIQQDNFPRRLAPVFGVDKVFMVVWRLVAWLFVLAFGWVLSYCIAEAWFA